MHRFYICPENWNRGALALTGSEVHHARDVLRIRLGEKVVLFNGQGREITAEIADFSDDEIGLRKLHEAETPPLRCRIVLAQAIPKGKNMELIVQKAVEIGAAEIAPIISDRTIVQVDSESAAQKQSKWQQIAIEAAKQCGQNWLPRVHTPRIAPARCPTLEEDPHRLFERTSTLPRERIDACWPGRRFHACGTCACAATWVSADHTRPDHPASGNCGNLLPECSLLRAADSVRRLKLGRLLDDRRFDGGCARKIRRVRALVRRRGFD